MARNEDGVQHWRISLILAATFSPVPRLTGMTRKKLEGHGRLVPIRSTALAYQVRYGIHVVGEATQHGRGVRPAQWAKCSVQFEDGRQPPDGSYFLYTDEGKVHQVKAADGKWHYLAVAA
jgi:hypothetical protein